MCGCMHVVLYRKGVSVLCLPGAGGAVGCVVYWWLIG